MHCSKGGKWEKKVWGYIGLVRYVHRHFKLRMIARFKLVGVEPQCAIPERFLAVQKAARAPVAVLLYRSTQPRMAAEWIQSARGIGYLGKGWLLVYSFLQYSFLQMSFRAKRHNVEALCVETQG